MKPSFAQFHPASLRTALLALLLAAGLVACATLPPPTAELNQAQQAVMRATEADADQYASESIATAREALGRAQAAMAQGEEDAARRYAMAAHAEADLAYAISHEAVASARLAQLQTQVERLQQRLQPEGSR